jgi:serine/threonine protein kinase
MVQRVTKDEQRIAEERGETLAASTSTDPSAARQTGGLDGKQQKALPASESKEGVDAAAANQSQSIPVPDPEPEPSGESDQTYFNSIDEKEQKKIIRRQKHRPSFCGTPEYMSPEILHNKGITLACDLYSLGVVIYQMLTASWPFKADTPYLTFKQTLVRDLSFPEGFDADAADLIDQLLARNPRERPGDLQSGGFAVLKAHPFFAGVDWHDLHLQPVPEMFVGPLDVALDADTREHILSFLDTKDVMVCGQVSQEWGRAAPTVLATRGIF